MAPTRTCLTKTTWPALSHSCQQGGGASWLEELPKPTQTSFREPGWHWELHGKHCRFRIDWPYKRIRINLLKRLKCGEHSSENQKPRQCHKCSKQSKTQKRNRKKANRQHATARIWHVGLMASAPLVAFLEQGARQALQDGFPANPSRKLAHSSQNRKSRQRHKCGDNRKHSKQSGTPRPVLTPMCVFGLTLYLVKPPSWGKVSGGCPSPFLFVPRNL